MIRKVDLKKRRVVFELDHRDMANVFNPDNLHTGARVAARKAANRIKNLPWNNPDAFVDAILDAISNFHNEEFEKNPPPVEQEVVQLNVNPHWLSDEEMMTLGEPQSNRQYKSDPTIQYCGLWFFFDEIWTSLHGPYNTRDEARAGATKYAREEL